MTEPKKGMDKMTKGFLIFISSAFIILTIAILFGNRTYELKGASKVPANAAQSQSASGDSNADFQPYLEEMHKQVSGKWQPPAVNQDSEVIVKFTILKNGHVINPEIVKSSGDKEVDDSALKALRKSSPLPPLPLSFPQEQVTINFNFTVRANQY